MLKIGSVAVLFVTLISTADAQGRPNFARGGTCSFALRYCTDYCKENPNRCISGACQNRFQHCMQTGEWLQQNGPSVKGLEKR